MDKQAYKLRHIALSFFLSVPEMLRLIGEAK